MKKSFIEKLGLEPVDKLNKTICRERVTFLKKKVKSGRLEGRLLKQAKYYISWYEWRAENGPRSPKRAA